MTVAVDAGNSDDAFDAVADQNVTVTCTDDDTAGFTVSESAGSTVVAESGGTDTFAVVLDARPESDVVLTVTSSDTGEATVDVAALTFTTAHWDTPQTVTVTGVDDDLSRDTDSAEIAVAVDAVASNDAFDHLATQAVGVTIQNDDIVFLSVADTAVSEAAGEVQFAVTLSIASAQTVSVAYSLQDGTARSGSDYAAAGPLTLEIPPGQLAGTIDVQIVADDIYEQDEQFVLELTIPVAAELDDATATATITDDDPLPTLAVAAATAGESAGSVAVTITLTGRAEAVVAVNLSTAPGTALAAEDYESHGSVVEWATTETGDKTVNIDIVNDPDPEDSETFEVQLSAPDNAGISNAAAAVTIEDDDGPPNFMMTLNFSGDVANSSLILGQNVAAEAGLDGLDVVDAGGGAAIDNYLASGDAHFQRELHPQSASGHWLVVVDVPLANATTMSWDFTGIALPDDVDDVYLHEVIDTLSIGAGIDMLTTTEIPIAAPQTFQISLGPEVSEDVAVAPGWTMLGLPVISGLTMGEIFDAGRDGELAEPAWRWDPHEARFILVSADDPAVPEAGYFVRGAAARSISVSGVEPDGVVQTVAGWQALSPVHAVTAESLLAAGVRVIWELSRVTGVMAAVSSATELQPGVSYWMYCTESVEVDLRGD